MAQTTRFLAISINTPDYSKHHMNVLPFRFAVNLDELETLRAFLDEAPRCLAPGGRMAVIAYHSLEDRLVKVRFRELAHEGGYILLTRKAMRPTPEEVQRNPRARSARLRCLERNP